MQNKVADFVLGPHRICAVDEAFGERAVWLAEESGGIVLDESHAFSVGIIVGGRKYFSN